MSWGLCTDLGGSTAGKFIYHWNCITNELTECCKYFDRTSSFIIKRLWTFEETPLNLESDCNPRYSRRTIWIRKKTLHRCFCCQQAIPGSPNCRLKLTLSLKHKMFSNSKIWGCMFFGLKLNPVKMFPVEHVQAESFFFTCDFFRKMLH